MKKIQYAFALSTAFAMLLAGCGSTNTASDSGSTAESSLAVTGKDYTVTPSVQFQPSESASVVSMACVEYALSNAPDSMAENADAIVEGEIVDVYYTAIDHTAWTQMDVLVDQCHAGGLETGDLISVYTLGGYTGNFNHIREDGNNEATTLSLPEGAELPQAGESYLFFLANSTDPCPVGEGVYETVLGYAGSLYENDNGNYVNDFVEASFSSQQLQTFVADNPVK